MQFPSSHEWPLIRTASLLALRGYQQHVVVETIAVPTGQAITQC
jgi:hypothetical protein